MTPTTTPATPVTDLPAATQIKLALLGLVTSKKFIAASAAIILCVLSRLAGQLGLEIDPTLLDRLYLALLVYTGAQGIADIGKPAAEVQAQAQVARALLAQNSAATPGPATTPGGTAGVVAP